MKQVLKENIIKLIIPKSVWQIYQNGNILRLAQKDGWKFRHMTTLTSSILSRFIQEWLPRSVVIADITYRDYAEPHGKC